MEETKHNMTVIFDLYGTLLSENSGWKAYRNLLNDLNFDLNRQSVKYVRKIILTKRHPKLTDLLHDLQINPTHRPTAVSCAELQLAEIINKLKPLPNVIKTLKLLNDKNIKIGVLSNASTPYKYPFEQLKDYIKNCVFSCDIGLIKPDPKIFKYTLARFGMDANTTVMIGNSAVSDIEGARSIGMKAVLVGQKRFGKPFYGIENALESVGIISASERRQLQK